MIQFDEKEEQIFNSLYAKIKNREFNEIDVYAFLILIREHLPKNYWLFEFANLVAHRKRCKGSVFANLKVSNSSFLSKPLEQWSKKELETKKIANYSGFSPKDIFAELDNVTQMCCVSNFAKKVKNEICLCIYSLLQFSTYEDKSQSYGEVGMLIDAKDIAVYTFMNNSSPIVCLSKMKNVFCKTGKVWCFSDKPFFIDRGPYKKIKILYDNTDIEQQS